MNAVLSGLAGAAAGVCGKIAFSSEAAAGLAPSGHYADSLVLPLRAAAGAAMLCLNGMMLSMFVRSMHSAGTVLTAVANNAANFLFTAALGYVLFSEELGAQWLLGAATMFLGLVVIAMGQQREGTGARAASKKK
eukprot:g4752.t1